MRLTMAFALLGILSAPVLALDSPASAPKKERKVCKEVLKTGSNLPARKCLTRAQWQDLAENGPGDDGEALSLQTKSYHDGKSGGVSGGAGPR